MNRIACTISSIKIDENIALITLDSENCGFLNALIIGQNLPYEIGQKVYALFRQTQVCVLDLPDSEILQNLCANAIKSRVVNVQRGNVISFLEFENSIRAIVKDCKSLCLGAQLLCVINPSEIMLETQC